MSEYKEFEELTIVDDWMFRTVMAEDPEAARMVASAALDEEINTVEKVGILNKWWKSEAATL